MVYVEEPEVGKVVKKGEVLTTVESVKAVSEVYAPVSGKILGWNEELKERAELIVGDPYSRGWIVLIEIAYREEPNSPLAQRNT